MTQDSGILAPNGQPINPSVDERVQKIENFLGYFMRDFDAVAKETAQHTLGIESILRLLIDKQIISADEYQAMAKSVHEIFEKEIHQAMAAQENKQQTEEAELLDGIAIT